ncbi:MAG: DUF2851 family protein [Flavobacteriaceae bacterium]|nr:DUF2851 family protein [Flavobacteriaceae bacterium]
MKEDFLHYLWKHKLFSLQSLITTNKESIELFRSGEHNHLSGPDFFNALLKIDGQRWAGNVEIHVKSSDWYLHGHEKDENYDNIILHVVWEHDVNIHTKNSGLLPTLELKNFIKTDVLNNYKKLFSTTKTWINCEKDIASTDDFLLNNWYDRLYIERLEEKSTFIMNLLKSSNNDWEAVLFKLLAKNFGLKINSEAFFELADRLNFSIIRKQRNDLESLEALIFGQAGFLIEPIENGYYQKLQKEYQYLTSKFNLTPVSNSRFQFFRLRPNNFPTIRIAQLAALYNQKENLFSQILKINELVDFYKLFSIQVSPFWKDHYSFTSASKKNNKSLTKSFIDLLLINTIVPFKFIYLRKMNKLNEEVLVETVRHIKPEKNSIIDKFNEIGISTHNAFQTQSLLQLKNEYCSKQKCLDCNIGNDLLNNC